MNALAHVAALAFIACGATVFGLYAHAAHLHGLARLERAGLR